MRVLCVAEKPSISKSVTGILSGGRYTTRSTRSQYIKNYDFDYGPTNSHYTMTAVSGHLTSHDFFDTHRKWHSCDPYDLFDANVKVDTSEDSKAIEQNLFSEARKNDMLMIWTDCDREGEHIGSEIAAICRRAKPNIQVKRARFSAIIAEQIHRAAQRPVELDQRQADAVEARTILDLKIGAAFTRLQTLTLQNEIQRIRDDKQVLSYGPCQFPTLGFVVARYKEVAMFKPEKFWYIHLALTRQSASQGNEETTFTWRRGHLFGYDEAATLYEMVVETETATVTKVQKKETKKWKPLPLTTVELQKAGSRLLKLSPKKILDIAEKLYNNGFLSYPRTETDQFDPQFNFASLIEKQKADAAWGGFATNLENGQFEKPRKGRHDDKAHPPIHPTAHAGNLAGDEKRVYEFITRRFLACCSKDAKGWQTTVEVEYGGEEFYATGLTVTEKNYLVVYPYDKWSDNYIPDFQEGEEFQPSVCELRDGQTSKPNLLTEADLVSLMDKNGIGTDATIAQHIETIVNRNYVIEHYEGQTKYLLPSVLGIGLIEGYSQIGLQKSLDKPQLRRETERRMVQVCQGAVTKDAMMAESLDQYKQIFQIARGEFNRITRSVRTLLQRDGNVGGGGGGGGGGDGPPGGGGGANGPARGGGGAAGGRGARGGGPGGGDNGGGAPPPPRPPRPPTSKPKAPPKPKAPARKPPQETIVIEDDDDDDLFADFDDPFDDDVKMTPAPPPKKRASTRAPPPKPVSAVVPPPSRAKPSVTDGGEPMCKCNVTAVQRTVTKESASKGRQFWTCHENPGCGFFQWAEDSTSGGGETPSVPAKRSYSATAADRVCDCNEPATSRTVVKDGPNKGRVFWKCPNPEGATCKYFEWDDEPSRLKGGSMSTGGYGGGGGGGAKAGPSVKCYKCDGEGHWANSCPNADVGSSAKRTKSTGGGGGSGKSGGCFTCGEDGHWTSECPNGGRSGGGGGRSFGGNSSNTRNSSGGGGKGECFNCGSADHWSNACPNGPGGGDGGRASTRGGKGSSRGRGKGTRGGRGKRGKGPAKTKTGGYGAPEGFF